VNTIVRRIWLAFGLLLDPSASAATEGGYGPALGWGDTRDYQYQNLWFDCGTPEEAVLVASFPAPTGVNGLYRLEAHIDFCLYGYPIPEWWRFDAGGCREGDLEVSADFRDGPSTHTDYWHGYANADVNFFLQSAGRARIEVTVEMDPDIASDVTPGDEIYAFKVRFLPPDTDCFGCPLGTCFMLNDSITLYHSLGTTEIPANNYDSYVRWQSESGFCPFIVSVDPESWGRLKAKYREP